MKMRNVLTRDSAITCITNKWLDTKRVDSSARKEVWFEKIPNYGNVKIRAFRSKRVLREEYLLSVPMHM